MVRAAEHAKATMMRKLEEPSVMNGANTSPHRPSSTKNKIPAKMAHASVATNAPTHRAERPLLRIPGMSA